MVYTLPKAVHIGFALPTNLATTTSANAAITFNSSTGQVGKGTLLAPGAVWEINQNGGGFELYNTSRLGFESDITTNGINRMPIVIGGASIATSTPADATYGGNENSIVIGHGARNRLDDYTTVINDATTIGYRAISEGPSGICIGSDSFQGQYFSCALGSNATIEGPPGFPAPPDFAHGFGSTAIGYSSRVKTNCGLGTAIGPFATCLAPCQTMIGPYAGYDGFPVVGGGSGVLLTGSLPFGLYMSVDTAAVSAPNRIMGWKNATGQAGPFANGSDGQVLTVVSGSPAWATPAGGGAGAWTANQDGGAFSLFNITRLNYEATVGGTNQKIIIGGTDTINTGSGNSTSIVIGHAATVNNIEQVCMGQGAVCSAPASVCIGRNALVDTGCDNSVAIGRNATNYAIRGCVVGTGATTIDATEDVTAIGYGSAAQANKSVSVGISAICTADAGESVSIGYNSFSHAYGCVVIGSNANSSEGAADAVSIGRGANVNPSTGGIAIGAGSGNGSEAGIAIGSLATTFATTTGQVSIGYLANSGGDMTDYALFLTPNLPNTTSPSHMLSFNSTSGQVGRSILPQHIYTASATNVQIATNIPVDNSIPQNTEGTELTAIASTITPRSASSTLRITVRVPFTIITADLVVCSLFRDSTANALATASAGAVLNTGMCMFVHEVTSGSTTSTTFKVRLGTSLGGTAHVPTSLVAGAGTEYFGQTLKYTMTIDEII